MKNRFFLHPLFVSAVIGLYVWFLALLFLPYSIRAVEFWGLYLNTPDFEVRFNICDFFSQFFYFPAVPSLFLAIFSALIFGLAWTFLKSKWLRMILSSVFIFLPMFFVFHPSVRHNERWAHIEYAAERFQWYEVLKLATPAACSSNRQMLPYAMLALAETGQLPDALRKYPVESSDDFDMEGQQSCKAYFFKSVLYESLNCTNEAIHSTFQAADFLPYGTSYGLLRRLARLYAKQENYLLQNKYRMLLSRTPFHPSIKPLFRNESDNHSQSNDSIDILVTKDLPYNIACLLDTPDHYSQALVHYYLCMLVADGRFDKIRSLVEKLYAGQPVPQIYLH